MPLQILAARQEARWDSNNVPNHRSLIGKTVGLLVSIPPHSISNPFLVSCLSDQRAADPARFSRDRLQALT
jgi:hypothetical protein